MALLLVARCLKLIEAGAHILIENPLMSYLWMLEEFLILMGLPGMALVRIDQCTYGTPYQKPQLWLTTNERLKDYSALCYHVKPHGVTLVGKAKARASEPYPPELAADITEAWTESDSNAWIEMGNRATTYVSSLVWFTDASLKKKLHVPRTRSKSLPT